MLTPKQIANQSYYRANRQQILRKKKEYNENHREQISEYNRERRPHNRSFSRRCFICGGVIVQDPNTQKWQCLNPECEAEFREVV